MIVYLYTEEAMHCGFNWARHFRLEEGKKRKQNTEDDYHDYWFNWKRKQYPSHSWAVYFVFEIFC